MKKKHIFLIALLVYANTALSDEESLEYLAKRINYAELPIPEYLQSTESCVLKANWLSLEGHNDESINTLNSCAECSSDILINSYYCFLIKANNYFWKKEMQSTARVYYSMANSLVLYENLSNIELGDMVRLGSNFKHVKLKVQNENLLVKKEGEYFTKNINGIEFIVDTAAMFGSIKPSNCNNKLALKTQVSSYTGQRSLQESCLLRFNDTIIPVIISDKNIVGQVYLNQYSGLVFNDEKPISPVKLYKDGIIFFFLGKLNYKTVHYINTKVCVDSGALQTTIMPSIYKKLKPELSELPIQQFIFKTPLGEQSTLGKVLPESKLSFSQNDILINLEDTPVLFRNTAFNQCDIVLGVDTISKFIQRIDITNSKVYMFDSSAPH